MRHPLAIKESVLNVGLKLDPGGARASDRPQLNVGFYSDATRWWGGAEIFLANLIGSLGPHIRPTVVGISAVHVERLAACRAGTVGIVLPRPRGITDIRALFAHRKAIAALQLDIFQVNAAWMLSCREAIVAASTIPGLRIVAVEHFPGHVNLCGRLMMRLIARRLDAHVGVGENSARALEAAAGLTRGSVRTIRNGVPDRGARRTPEASADATVIGCLARLEWRKGIDVLLEAVAGISNVRLVIAGEGDGLRATLTDEAARLGIAERVRILEQTDKPRELLETFDVFTLPSRAEAFPLSIVEAMLAALPVVATNVGSVCEAVVDGETGFIVPADDVAGLRSALAELCADPELRRRMGDAGRLRAAEHFTVEVMALAYETLYDELCNPRAAAGARYLLPEPSLSDA